MDNLTFTIDTSELDNTDFNQLTNDIQAFINILHHASPDFTTVGIILQKQLDEQVKKHEEEADPRTPKEIRRTTKLAISKLTKEELLNKAQERFNTWIRMYDDTNVTAEQMYEDMTCSIFTGDANYDKINNDKPVLDRDFCFSYKGYDFELSSCNNIIHRNQIVGLTMENIKERFPNGIFSDRYVCWMWGHKDCEGHTKEEVDNPEFFAPNIYLVPDAWSWGTDDDLKLGAEVNPLILAAINNFLETFKEVK